MSIYNLQDKAISSSFDELIQIDDNNFLRDGTGSLRQELKTTGSFSASTYFGDGSNLTGIAAAVNTGSLLTTASNDFSEITFTKGDGSQFTLDTTPRVVYESVKNGSNQTLPKGTPVYASGSVGNAQLVFSALASNDATMPAVYILAQELEAGEEGFGITHGFINGVNTSLFTAGDEVYVGSNGGFTNQRPTGSNLIQKLGTVVRIDANNGSGVIQIDSIVSVPNIQQGYAWVGDINGVAQPIPTSSFVVSIDTGSLLTTASFDNGTRDLTFAKGDSSTFSVNIPGGSIETGSFATTGSNTFIGNQNIIGELTSSVAKSNVILNPQTITENITIGPDNNAFIVGPVAIDGVITVEGDSELYIHTPPTFIDTGSFTTTASFNAYTASNDNILATFATTGSNTFQGTQTINGNLNVQATSSFEQVLITNKLLVSQSAPIQNDFDFPADGQVRFMWKTQSGLTGGSFNMQNGAFQFSNNSGIGMLFDAPGTKYQVTTPNIGNHMLALSAQPTSFVSLNVTQYTGSCAGIIYNQSNSFNSPTRLLVGAKYSASFDDTLYTDMNFFASGSANISTLKLREQDPLPTGSVGDLATSGSELYFNDGTNWRQVNLT